MSRFACRTCGAPTDGLTATCGSVPCVRVDLAATRVIAARSNRLGLFRQQVLRALVESDAPDERK